MKKMIVFGASGGTGIEIVKLSLAAGHEVTAVVRSPDAFILRDSRLTVIKGDVLDPSSFVGAMKGKDIVVSAIGNRSTKPTTVYSAGIHNILHAMQVQGIKRFIGITAGALDTNAAMGFFIRTLTKLVLQKILKEPYADMRLMESKLFQSGTNYMIMRPAMLKDKRLTGKYRVAVNGHIKVPFSIARADLAHFITTHLDDHRTFKSIVEIAY
jgi:putative NADH-flavin reductase